MKSCIWIRSSMTVLCVAGAVLGAGGCAFKPSGYGVGPQAERAAALQAAQPEEKPDTPGMYLALIDKMQAEGLYYASLAHVDAYEQQYGVSPESTLLRADALRMTGQAEASAAAYRALLATPLAARGFRGLGLLAGAAGRFDEAARQLARAVALAPTEASTLSDLGYARLRDGDVAGARVPLMKAAELDARNPRILSNMALLLLAEKKPHDAHALMDAQQFSASVRHAIREDARKIAAARRALHSARAPGPRSEPGTRSPVTGDAALAALKPGEPAPSGFAAAPPMLRRFAQ